MTAPSRWTFFKKGRCEVCGKHGAERSTTIEAPTDAEVSALGEEWKKAPIRHRRCE